MLPATDVTVDPFRNRTASLAVLVLSSVIVAASDVVPVEEIVASEITMPSNVLPVPLSRMLPSTDVIDVPAEMMSIPAAPLPVIVMLAALAPVPVEEISTPVVMKTPTVLLSVPVIVILPSTDVICVFAPRSLTPVSVMAVDVPLIIMVAVPVDETTASARISTPSPLDATPVKEMLPDAAVTVVPASLIVIPSSPVALAVVPLSVMAPEVV